MVMVIPRCVIHMYAERGVPTQCVVVAQVSRLVFVRFKFDIPPACPCCLPAFPRPLPPVPDESDTKQ